MEFNEETFTEAATGEETFAEFRRRMIALAVKDDAGIVSYSLDGEILDPNYKGDAIGWTEMKCEFRRKVATLGSVPTRFEAKND
ncbi:hypothetical protein GOB98_28860 [Sinorhizobium meliloti]|nr:hypothetical protein [Sinorhizobium meliloti]MDW9980000.1 hypothetical protein [Sinorhizobium meliloti]MDX0296610.1 hypothetical protein [Sinorhizobium meliloti]